MNTFKNGKWIWINEGGDVDVYADFIDTLTYKGEGKVVINLSVDSDYALFINGKYIASNQYGDFEHYKIYDTVDVTSALLSGENSIKILAYHCGTDNQRYKKAAAGLIYEVYADGVSVAHSDSSTLSRLNPAYASGRGVILTWQLGYTFFYDSTKECDTGYGESVLVEKNCRFFPRPIKKATVKERAPMKNVTRISDTYVRVDLGGEVVGLPQLEIISSEEQTVKVGWGEHLDDGCVRDEIGGRNFMYEYTAKKGENLFTEYMLRIGCRYLEIRADAPMEVKYLGVLPQVYEVESLPCEIDGELERKIYEMCENTLRLCMMEHYVDCPWREQALYTCDSRNQMLCGYYAFKGKNAEYARANLRLIGMDWREDGLLSICYPSGSDLAIPSFSLYYLIEMLEYIEYTGDVSLAVEMLPKMKNILTAFINNSEGGLMYSFEGNDKWNFYDWSKYADGRLGMRGSRKCDLAVNALSIIALDSFEKICYHIGEEFPYSALVSELRSNVRERFMSDNGIFTMTPGEEHFTVLANSLAVLAGVVTGEEAERVCDAIVSDTMPDCSLSMKLLEYDALLNTNTEKYSSFVLSQIAKNYKVMADYGSDTVWETIIGAEDFQKAGSLCHGWSAVPVYIYHRLKVAKRK